MNPPRAVKTTKADQAVEVVQAGDQIKDNQSEGPVCEKPAEADGEEEPHGVATSTLHQLTHPTAYKIKSTAGMTMLEGTFSRRSEDETWHSLLDQ